MITEMLRNAVRVAPEKLAIVRGEERIRYDQLEDRVMRLAGGLRAMGLAPGDCIAAALPNCCEFVIAFLASAALRAIFLPLNPQYTRSELQRFIVDARAKIVFAGRAERDVCLGLAGSPRFVSVGDREPGFLSFEELSNAPRGFEPTAGFTGSALYLYTSGSTDSYKRVCCTQENLYFEARNFIDTMRLTADDTILCTIPLFHSYGIGNCLMDALGLGATLAMLEPAAGDGYGSAAPFPNRCGALAELIRREAPRFYPGVPYQFSVLAGLPEAFPIDFSTLRLCISSGDVLPKRTYDKFLARFGQPIRSLYGSTEAGSIAIDSAPNPQLRFGASGPPLRNVTVEIRDPAGKALGVDFEGDIWVASPTLPPTGYDNRPELNGEVFRDGFYRTGDLGRLDAEGRLTLTGRKQSFVDIAGYKVDLGEVEEVLQDCPGVLEAAAVGVFVENMGALIKAAVVAEAGCGEDQIRAYCRGRLAFVKVPRLIELRAALPRASTGKVLRSELSDVAAYLARIRDEATMKSVNQLRSAPSSRRRKLVRSIVRAQTAAVLALGLEDISDETGFTALGMDSFASIELRARLEYLFERELPGTLAFDHPTVASVVEFLHGLVGASNDEHEMAGSA